MVPSCLHGVTGIAGLYARYFAARCAIHCQRNAGAIIGGFDQYAVTGLLLSRFFPPSITEKAAHSFSSHQIPQQIPLEPAVCWPSSFKINRSPLPVALFGPSHLLQLHQRHCQLFVLTYHDLGPYVEIVGCDACASYQVHRLQTLLPLKSPDRVEAPPGRLEHSLNPSGALCESKPHRLFTTLVAPLYSRACCRPNEQTLAGRQGVVAVSRPSRGRQARHPAGCIVNTTCSGLRATSRHRRSANEAAAGG